MSGPGPLAEDPVRWGPITVGLLAGGGFLAAAGLYLHDAVPLFLAIPLLIAPLLAIAQVPRPVGPGELRWSAGGSGKEVLVEGTLSPPEGISPDGVALEFFPPAPLEEVGPPIVRRTATTVEFRREYSAVRPCLALFPRPRAVWRDPIGCVEVPFPLDAPAIRIERYPPEVSRLRATHLRRTTVFPGEVRSRQRGGAGDFFAIRPSTVGDTPKQINWRATARAGTLLANEYQVERTGDLVLVLDLRPTPLGPRRDGELVALARSAALGIASAFLQEKARVGVAIFDEYLTPVPLASGRAQRFRIQELLLRAVPGTVSGPPERLAVSLARYYPRGVTTLLISSMAGEDTPLVLAHLRRRGFSPMVLTPSPIPLILPKDAALQRPELLAGRLLHLARRRQLATAWEEAPVIEWEEYWSLAPLVRFLAQPLRRTGGAT